MSAFIVTCRACGERFDAGIEAPMEVHAFVQALFKLRCPRCDADRTHLALGGGARQEGGAA